MDEMVQYFIFWWGFLLGNKYILGLVVKICLTLSAAIGSLRQDGMDGNWIYWMTLLFWELPSELMLAFPCCCAQLAGLSGGEIFYLGYNRMGWMAGLDGRAYWMILLFFEAFQMQQFLMDLVDYWYSWNNYVSFHSIATKIKPLDSHKIANPGVYKYARKE